MIIKGISGILAEVSKRNRLQVNAPSPFQEALYRGDAFTWTNASAPDIDAGDTMLFVKNTSEVDLVVSSILFSGSNVICNWFGHIGNATTTPAGTAVTGVNLNRNYAGKTADVIALQDETAVADGDKIFDVWTPITNSLIIRDVELVLGNGHYLQVNQETESTSGSVTIIGYYNR